MRPSDPRSWLDRVVGACLSVLVGAVAVYIAVRLIEAVWVVLVVIGIVAACIALAVTVLRSRRNGW